MSSHIDFRTMPANVPVLCIPRVYPNISESRIRRIFDDLNMGTLERIDIVSKYNVKPGARPAEKGEKFNRVFVHFRRWNDTENANIARERLLNGKEIKIIYDDPWFWKISAYREAERKPSAPHKSKPTLQFDSDDEERSSNSKPVNRHQDDRKAQGANRSARALEPFGLRPDVRPDVRRSPPPPRATHQASLLERPENQDNCVYEGLTIDYGEITIPPRRKLGKANSVAKVTKKPLQIIEDENRGKKKDDEKEEGELSE